MDMGQRAKRIDLKGVVDSRSLAAPFLGKPGDAVLIERGMPRMMILRCPCGCGDDLVINLDRRAGPAWRLYRGTAGTSLHPSYWRDGGCGCHFILWSDRIYWCFGWNQRDEDDDWFVAAEIEEQVIQNLSLSEFARYWEVADNLSLLPWEVLQACRQLVQRGFVEEGKGRLEGAFRRTGFRGV